MLTAAISALGQMFTAPLRAVLLKSIGLSLLLIVIAGVAVQRLAAYVVALGAGFAEQSVTGSPHALWEAMTWVLSIVASLGIIAGAIFLMPAVTAFVGSFFVDEIADVVERTNYPAELPGKALPLARALAEGVKTALLALLIYALALPFIFFAIGFFVLFFANAWLLGREYFELAAMRFRSSDEAKALRKRHAAYLFGAGMIIAAVVSIPVVSLVTPIFAMAFMVHIHKQLSGPRPELIEPQRDARRLDRSQSNN